MNTNTRTEKSSPEIKLSKNSKILSENDSEDSKPRKPAKTQAGQSPDRDLDVEVE